jgi:hypothetical protein
VSHLVCEQVAAVVNEDIRAEPTQGLVEQPQELARGDSVGRMWLYASASAQSDRHASEFQPKVKRAVLENATRADGPRAPGDLFIGDAARHQPGAWVGVLGRIGPHPRERFDREGGASQRFHHRPAGDGGAIGVVEVRVGGREEDPSDRRALPSETGDRQPQC